MRLSSTLNHIWTSISTPPCQTIADPIMVHIAEAGPGDARLFEVVIFINVQVEDWVEVNKLLVSSVG